MALMQQVQNYFSLKTRFKTNKNDPGIKKKKIYMDV